MARKNTIPVEVLAETQRKRNKALEMRLSGMTQAQIVAETGWGKSSVSEYISKAISDITRENAEEYLALELDRLDAMLAAIWNDIISAKTAEAKSARTWNIDRALAIMDQRAKLTGHYKHAELKAIAAAKGGISAETSSMLGRLFDAMETVVNSTNSTTDADDDDALDEPSDTE